MFFPRKSEKKREAGWNCLEFNQLVEVMLSLLFHSPLLSFLCFLLFHSLDSSSSEFEDSEYTFFFLLSVSFLSLSLSLFSFLLFSSFFSPFLLYSCFLSLFSSFSLFLFSFSFWQEEWIMHTQERETSRALRTRCIHASWGVQELRKMRNSQRRGG